MRFSIASALTFLLGVATASTWTVADGTVEVGASSFKFSDKESITLAHGDRLKISLTAKDGNTGKRPHQAFLVLREKSGLEAPFPLTIKESGKGSVELTQKDLPTQLLLSQEPLIASIILGSFGASQASVTPVFDITLKLDPNAPQQTYEPSMRYGQQPEIHHIFKSDPKNPPKVVSVAFALAVIATVPSFILGSVYFGANVCDAQKALGSAPISHITFFGSIIAMEGVFFLYYSKWDLFTTLPFVGVIGVVAFLSGTKALGEMQRRRLAGQR